MTDKTKDTFPFMINRQHEGIHMSMKSIFNIVRNFISFKNHPEIELRVDSISVSEDSEQESHQTPKYPRPTTPGWQTKMGAELSKTKELMRICSNKHIAKITGTGEIIEMINPEYSREEFWPTLYKIKCNDCKMWKDLYSSKK